MGGLETQAVLPPVGQVGAWPLSIRALIQSIGWPGPMGTQRWQLHAETAALEPALAFPLGSLAGLLLHLLLLFALPALTLSFPALREVLSSLESVLQRPLRAFPRRPGEILQRQPSRDGAFRRFARAPRD